jgi:hypothetical protein
MFLLGLFAIISFSAPVGMRGAAVGPIVGITYWVIGGLYLAPAFHLYKYASSIDDLLKGGGDTAMEMALGSQKSFWRFMGIVMIVVLSLYALIFLFAIFAATRMRSF